MLWAICIGASILCLCFAGAAWFMVTTDFVPTVIFGVAALILLGVSILAGFKAEASTIPTPIEVRCKTIHNTQYSKADDACYANGIKLNFKEENGE